MQQLYPLLSYALSNAVGVYSSRREFVAGVLDKLHQRCSFIAPSSTNWQHPLCLSPLPLLIYCTYFAVAAVGFCVNITAVYNLRNFEQYIVVVSPSLLKMTTQYIQAGSG